MKRDTFACAALIALPISAFAQIEIHRDAVIPAAFDNELSVTYNRPGDRFTATVFDNRYEVPPTTRFEGHIIDIRLPEGDHRGSMQLHFDSMILPDGNRIPIDAVPVPLDSRGIRRDRLGRMRADEKRLTSDQIFIGSTLGGLFVGSLIGKPFEGTFLGALAGIALSEAARNDPRNQTDLVARRGSPVGILFMSDVRAQFDDHRQYPPRDWRDGNMPAPPGYNPDADFYRPHDYQQGPPPPQPDRAPRPDWRNGNPPNGYPLNQRDEVAYDRHVINFPVEQQPYRSGDVLMVPLQFMSVQLGLGYDARPEGRIYIENEDNMLRLDQDSKTFRLNGHRGELPAIVENHSGVLYAPIEILATLSARPVYVNGTKVEPIS